MKQMSFEEFQAAAAGGQYRMIPVYREILADIRTPLQVLMALQNVSSHCFLLESAEDSRKWGRYTYLGYDPSMELSCKNHHLTVFAGGKIEMETDHPGVYIKQIVNENRAPALPGLPTLTGGLVGYFSYDYVQYGEPELKLDALDEDDFG